MYKKAKLAGLSLLAGFLMVSCSLPALLNAQLQEFLNSSTPYQTQTPQTSPGERTGPEVQSPPQEMPIQVVDRRIFEEGNDPEYVVDGVRPNLVGPEGFVGAFNTESDQLIEGIEKNFLNSVSDRSGEMAGQGEPQVSHLIFNYDLTYSDPRLFSFLLTFDQYIAISAHPFPFSHALNYDAQNGSFLRLEDLFVTNSDYIFEIGSRLDPILDGRGFGYEVGTAAEVMRERENWNLLPEGLQINFDVYEVAPYAAGPQNILIPWEDLTSILDPDGPAGIFIE